MLMRERETRKQTDIYDADIDIAQIIIIMSFLLQILLNILGLVIKKIHMNFFVMLLTAC